MTEGQLDALLLRYVSDRAFATALDAAGDIDDARRIAHVYGFDLTRAELVRASDHLCLAAAEWGTGPDAGDWGLVPETALEAPRAR